MRTARKSRWLHGTACLAVLGLSVSVVACGSEDFKNKPRPAVAVELTGVIQKDKVTVSPSKVGAGPISITIANETNDAHTLTLEGDRVRERVAPINPQDTATIQKTLVPGTYEVRAGSSQAVPKEIAPATLKVGRPRKDSSDQLLLP
jgi:hypothetical protein